MQLQSFGEDGSARPKAFRKPVRITITLAYCNYSELERLSGEQGRSLSNLAAYLLEGALQRIHAME
jgi:CopG-like RHH_1 or ribbon-helix-helix domain, RHH_5